MLGYVTIGTNDLPRATAFYDAIAAEMGGRRIMESDKFVAWGPSDGSPGFGVTLPFDGKPATPGNGVMIALITDERAQVDRIYQLALSLGATDDGPPGERFTGLYIAFFRDLDGNKVGAYMMG